MATLLDIKKQVASQMGKSDWATANEKRNNLINAARREYYQTRRWNYLKTTATLTFSGGAASFPTEYNPLFDPGEIYSYVGTQKTTYTRCSIENLSKYAANSPSDFYYAIDFANSQIKSNQQTTTPTISFHKLPADKAVDTSDDTDAEPAPDITPIVLLATAMVWLSQERDEDEYKTFYLRYQDALKRCVQNDKTLDVETQLDNYTSKFSLGYNE